MTVFNFSTGNPANLVGGGGANMTDIGGSLTDLKSFLNGGSMDETNVPNLAAAFTHWKTIGWGGGLLAMGAGGTYILSGGGNPQASSGAVSGGSAGSASFIMDLDPADWLANARTTKLRLRCGLTVNAVAPSTSFNVSLYPVATVGGSSGQAPSIATLGTLVSGSTVTFTTPTASTRVVTASTEFTAPAVGPYAFGVLAGGGVTAGSSSIVVIQLQMRQV